MEKFNNYLMKKFLIVLGVLTIFSGCSGTFKDDPEFTAMKGVLTAQKTDDTYPGTHLLIDDGGQVTPLRSLSINLDSTQYLNNKIEALGIMNPNDNVFEVTGISVIEVLVDKTEEGKLALYKSSEYGFEISYYDNWIVDDEGETVIFNLQDEEHTSLERITIEQIPYSYYPTTSEDGTTDTPLGAYFLAESEEDVSGKINKIGVDGLDAVKAENTDNSIVYTLYRSGLVYKISYLPSSNAENLENRNVFLEMVNTFRFIGFEVDAPVDDSEEVPVESDLELRTFESLPYSFSGQYPKSWYYAGKKGSGGGVRHHYGFSDESVTDENELISLEVLSSPGSSGQKEVINGREIYVQSTQSTYTIYTTVDDSHYELSGDLQYKDLILSMALAIESIKELETLDLTETN